MWVVPTVATQIKAHRKREGDLVHLPPLSLARPSIYPVAATFLHDLRTFFFRIPTQNEHRSSPGHLSGLQCQIGTAEKSSLIDRVPDDYQILSLSSVTAIAGRPGSHSVSPNPFLTVPALLL